MSSRGTLADVESKISFARNLYSERDGDQLAVEQVYKASFVADRDVIDAGLTVVNIPTGQAVVKMYASYLGVGLDIGTMVLPFDESAKEQALCTKLERYLASVRWASEYESHRRAYSNFVWFYLTRGWGVFKVLFCPELVDTHHYPIRILDRDPHYVYPVFGDTGPLYVVEAYDRYVGDLRRELDALWDRKRNKDAVIWKPPDFGEYVDTEEVEVVEYWDTELKGLRIAGEWIWLMPHHYNHEDGTGIIPYSFAFCEKTPLNDGKWMGRSVLAPIADIIKQQAILIGKVTDATELFYYPQILTETPHGESFVMSSAPGQQQPIPPGSKITILNPTPNQMLITTLMGWYESAIDLFGLPRVMWGQQPGEVQAGYGIAMLQAGAKTKINEKANEIQTAIARTHEHVLRLTEIFAPLTEGGFKIHPTDKPGPPLVITADDVAGHYRNRVTITPDLPQDAALQWRTAQMAREPHGVTRLPLISDALIREDILKIRHPDVEAERVLNEFLAINPEVQQIQAQLFVQQWLKDNRKEIDKMQREMEKEQEKQQEKQQQDMAKQMEAMVMQAYQEAMAAGQVPAELMPAGGQPGMQPGPPMAGEGSMAGMSPAELPPSFLGQGPSPVLPQDMGGRVAERMLEIPGQGPPVPPGVRGVM